MYNKLILTIIAISVVLFCIGVCRADDGDAALDSKEDGNVGSAVNSQESVEGNQGQHQQRQRSPRQ